jgi:glycosyltransferase involved in cell wall biosynthesis
MRIVIDMQGAQTQSRFRGIGRYTIDMVRAILRGHSEHEIFLAFNALMPESIVAARQQLGDSIKEENIIIWHALGPVCDDDERNTWRRRVAEESYKTFLQDVQADLLFVSSYIEGYRNNAVTCVAAAEFGFTTCVVIYDLIPLLNADQYFVDAVYARHYKRKLEEMQGAAFALTISEFSRTEALEHLSFVPDQITNTYLGADAKFRPLILTTVQRQVILQAFNLEHPFIFYAGGSDERKNLPRLIQAFAALPKPLRQSHQLLLAGKFSKADQAHLQNLADDSGLKRSAVCFTGYISDETMVELYNLCALFVFPSWHEGFGLPVLEAMACGAPTIVANCSSLPEVLAHSSALFDPFDVKDISRKIAEFLESSSARQHSAAHGLTRAQHFSWNTSAAIAMSMFNQVLAQQPVRQSMSAGALDTAMSAHYERLLDRIGELSRPLNPINDEDLKALARCIDANQVEARRVLHRVQLPIQSQWCVQAAEQACAKGVTHLSSSLVDLGQCLTEQTTQANVWLSALPQQLLANESRQVKISYGLRLAQTTLSGDWVGTLNDHAHGVVVQTHFMRKLLIDAGIFIPIAVNPDGLDVWAHLLATQRSPLTQKNNCFLADISDIKYDGLDVLLSAYGQVFKADDDVSLFVVVDDSAMPDAEVCFKTWRLKNVDLPEVLLVSVTDDAERKALYLQAQCLIAPCRFQDTGLAVRRALTLGLPVLTTGWGGQSEHEASDRIHYIDYQLTRTVYSTEETSLFDMYWAEPDCNHLVQLMREQYAHGQGGVLNKVAQTPQTWSAAATALNHLAHTWSVGPVNRPLKVGWVTTWNTRCGIASYSEHLTECMTEEVIILAPRRAERLSCDTNNVVRCWDHDDQSFNAISLEIKQRAIDTLVVQFNYGFFQFQALVDFVTLQASRHVKIVMTMHSTVDPVYAPERRLATLIPALKLCHRVLVHSLGDLNRLKSLGLKDNVTLFSLGVKVHVDDEGAPEHLGALEGKEDGFVLATYGFFLPHKGLLELIDAVALLRGRGCKVSLKMVNAEYPVSDSLTLIQQAKVKIAALGLTPYIHMTTDFLPDEESLALLEQADLVVYPYQETVESASGAVRFGLAAMRPVVVTPLAIFDDVDVAVFRLPGFSPELIAEGLQTLINDLHNQNDKVVNKLQLSRAWCSAHQYSKLASRMEGILKAEQN